jgi:hypothetical protein
MELSPPTRRLRMQLRRTWLLWSCLPLVVILVGLAATTAVYASQPVLSQKRAEDSFYALLAISALVFLFAFTIDGHWTNPKRVAQRIRRRLEAGPAGAPESLGETRAAIATEMVLGSSTALGLMGHVIGVIAILCVVGAAGAVYAYLLLAVAVSYQLYLFSRHPFYEQIVEAAFAGELEAEEEDGKRDKSAKADRRK